MSFLSHLSPDHRGWPQYTFMAKVLESYLSGALERRATLASDLPKGVWHSATQFFANALDAKSMSVDSRTTRSIARETLFTLCSTPESWKEGDLETILATYAEFTKTLHADRELTDEELETARNLRAFFRHISACGERERIRQDHEDSDDE